MHIFLTLFLLIASACVGSGSALASEEAVEKVKELAGQLGQVNTGLGEVNGQIAALQQELAALDQQDQTLQATLKQSLGAFHETARTVVHMERTPLQASFLEDALRVRYQRLGVLTYAKKGITAQVEKDKAALRELTMLRTKRADILTQLAQLKEQLSTQRADLEQLFVSHLNQAQGAERRTVRSYAEQVAKDRYAADHAASASALKASGVNNTQPMAAAPDEEEMKPSVQGAAPASKAGEGVPVAGKVVMGYHETDASGMTSYGVTYATAAGAAVKAVRAGKVIYSDAFRDYGYLVIVEHEDGLHTVYGGLQNGSRRAGDAVKAGDVLGVLPSTAEIPHLYVEVRRNGKPIDPKGVL